jgi:hypothetical protein
MIRNLFIIITMAISTNAYSGNGNDIVIYGYNNLLTQFEKYEKKFVKCFDKSKETLLSDTAIKKLQRLPDSASNSLGFFYNAALAECTQPEYNKLMTDLLTAEYANRYVKINYIDTLIAKVKILGSFSESNLYSQRSFEESPQNVKDTLNSIEELKNLFSPVDASERAWPEMHGLK